MSTELENNVSKNELSPTEEMKFTERMRKATRKEHRISDSLINAKMTIGNLFSLTLILIDCNT